MKCDGEHPLNPFLRMLRRATVLMVKVDLHVELAMFDAALLNCSEAMDVHRFLSSIRNSGAHFDPEACEESESMATCLERMAGIYLYQSVILREEMTCTALIKVRVEGLLNHTHYNGLTGTLFSNQDTPDRTCVRLFFHNRELLLKT